MNTSHRSRPDSGARRTLPIRSLALALVIIAVGAVAADAAATGALPLSPADLGATKANGLLQVKPATITYTGDGTGFLGGAHARKRNAHIHWTKWTGTVALGSGFNQLDNCNPDCATGKYHGYAVKIEMWRPRTIGGNRVFTRLTIFYKNHRPAGTAKHYTFTDIFRKKGGYGWGPPDAQDYCVNTHGLPPAQGCKNIHSLP